MIPFVRVIRSRRSRRFDDPAEADGEAAASVLPRQRFANSESRADHRQILKLCWRFSRVLPFWEPVMMGRPPRVPVDLQAVTRDVKARVRRVIGELEAIEQQQDPIFASPRDVFLELVLSIHELEAAAAKMRKAWWPQP
jgi:hypothetical protein